MFHNTHYKELGYSYLYLDLEIFRIFYFHNHPLLKIYLPIKNEKLVLPQY
jgi:hypothetical protein